MLLKIFNPLKYAENKTFPGLLKLAKILYTLGLLGILFVLLHQVPKLIVSAMNDNIAVVSIGFVVTTYNAFKAPFTLILLSISIAVFLQIEQHLNDIKTNTSK